MSELGIEKVYIDTNILVSYALGPDKDEKFGVAKTVFDGAMAGRYHIVVSHFLLTETLHALRSVVTRLSFRNLENGLTQKELIRIANSTDFQESMRKASKKAFNDIVDIMTKDSEHFSFEAASKQSYSAEIFKNSLAVLNRTFGVFRVYRFRCDKCDNYTPCRACRTDSSIVYKATNAPDLMHVSIAQTLGCDRFFTMDQYYSGISTEVSMPITILR